MIDNTVKIIKHKVGLLNLASVGRALRPTFSFISPQIQSSELVLHSSLRKNTIPNKLMNA